MAVAPAAVRDPPPYGASVTPHRVALLVPQRFSMFEVGIALEIFAGHRSGLPEPWYDVQLCAADPAAVLADCGLVTVPIPYGLDAVDAADTVIVAGAGVGGCPVDPDQSVVPPDPDVLAALRRAHARGARIVSFCDGAFVLAFAGLLDDRRATTHWKHTDRLARAFPRIRVEPDVLYVDDGRVLTSAGTAAAVDLALHVVRRDHGARVARQVARHMVMPPHREGGQAQFIMTPVPERGAAAGGVQKVMEHVVHHLDQEFSLADLAAIAFMSTRNFTRRFREVTGTTPAQWVLSQRLTRARELLEETDETVERIARLAGFGSVVTMRQRFVAVLGTSPSSYRRAFRDTASAGDTALAG